MRPIRLLLPLLFVLAACGAPVQIKPQKNWIKDGSVILSRSVPTVSTASEGILGGLMPLPASMKALSGNQSPSCVIDLVNGKISLLNGEKEIGAYRGEITKSLQPGRYKVALKQSTPSWYAPDSYFLLRKLVLPPEGSKDRLLKGALGDTALFLDNGLALHDSAVFSEDVGGVRMSKATATQLSVLLPVGSLVEVR